jgi:DNA-binding MarR family transcriptional regulator
MILKTDLKKTCSDQVLRDYLEPLKKIRQIMNAGQKHTAAIEKRCGVNGGQLWIMAELKDTPDLRIGALAKRLAANQATISNLVEDLARKGLIERSHDPADLRATMIKLTSAGSKVLAKAPQPPRGVLPEALAQLDKKTIDQLNKSLQTLIEEMNGIDEQFGMQLLQFNLNAK